MRTNELLSLTVFKNPKGKSRVDAHIALDRLAHVRRVLDLAETKAESPEGQALRCFGFVAVVFSGPNGTEYVKRFDRGHAACISPDGRGIEREEGLGPDNVAEARAWLEMISNYVTWVIRTGEAIEAKERPPVFSHSLMPSVDVEIRNWIGTASEDYFKTWHGRARLGHANTTEAVPA